MHYPKFLFRWSDRKDKEKVAEELKISLSTLYRKLERYNLKV
ncbi:helix-turn-helix domain-containing protein [Peribacillus simplex]